jgi:ABC-type lipoprotein release transport system permease subunit
MKEFFIIAWRNLGRNLRRTIIITAAVALGVWGGLVSMSIFNSLGHQMVGNFINSSLGHIQIHAKGYVKNPGLRLCMTDADEVLSKIKGAEHLAGYAPRIYGFALAQSARTSQGVMMVGIDPVLEPTVTRIRQIVKSGSYFSANDDPGVLIGKSLAAKLKVKVGDKLSFYLQSFEGGEDVVESFRVRGIFESGISTMDKSVVYLPLQRAEKIMKMENRINEIAIKADQDKNMGLLKADLQNKLAGEKPELMVHTQRESADGKEFELMKITEPGVGNLILAPEAMEESFKRNAKVANLALRLELPLAAVHRTSAGRERHQDLQVLGVEPVNENKLSGIFNRVEIPAGSWLKGAEMDKELEANQGWVILGDSAAEALGAEPGDTIRLGSGDKIFSLEVTGKLKDGLEQSSGKPFAVVSRSDLWLAFVSRSAASEVAVKLKDHADPEKTRDELLAGLGLEVQDWKEIWPFLDQYIQIINYTNLVLLLCIFIIIAFGIANTMVMSVFERMRELGILKAIGTSPRQLFSMVIMESVMLAVIGMALGSLASAITIGVWAKKGLDLSMFAAGLASFGFPTIIYPVLSLENILTALIMAFMIAILSALYPALRASRLPVVEALRKI